MITTYWSFDIQTSISCLYRLLGKKLGGVKSSEKQSTQQPVTSLIRKRSLKNNTVPKDLTIEIENPFGETTRSGKQQQKSVDIKIL